MKKYILVTWILFLICSLSIAQNQEAAGDALMTEKKYKEAVAAFRKIDNANGNNIPLLFKIGVCLQLDNQLDAAETEYLKIIKAQNATPRNLSMANYNLAAISAIRKNADMTFSYLRAGITAAGIDPDFLEKDQDFIHVKNDPRFAQVVVEARQQIESLKSPCKGNAEATAFGFWVGEWSVSPTNSPTFIAGRSKVEFIVGECAILENWQSTGPGPGGKSFNFLNPSTKKWEQHWIGISRWQGATGAAITKYENGEYRDGAMRFTFNPPPTPDGKQPLGRFTFYNLGPDRVRQVQESSNDNGKTWITAYDFIYTRVK